jgi:hypothetical protein
MRFLPLAMTQGPLLAEAVRDAAGGSRRIDPCGWCGTRLHGGRTGAGQSVRCAVCLRVQPVMVHDDTPWRLTPAAAEALRRTRTWLRWV